MNMMELLGRLHPLVLHLPIGIYSLAFLLQFLLPAKKRPDHATFQLILLTGWFTALLSVVFGWMLSLSGDYNPSSISWHKWSAVAFLVMCSCLSVLHHFIDRFQHGKKAYSIAFIFLMLLMTSTGHFGGELTHGEGYLFADEELSASPIDSVAKIPLTDTSQSTVYDALLVPVMQTKCISCHRAQKIKGGLRMDQYERLMKGGKGGEVLIPGDPENSEMIRRMLLDLNDDKHMPPKGKTQLTEKEIQLFHWWIKNGAKNNSKIKDVVNDTIKAFLTSAASIESTASLPQIAAPDPQSLKLLKDKGFTVKPVAISSGFMEVSSVNLMEYQDNATQALSAISKNILWLNLSRLPANDKALTVVGSMHNLQRADFSYTKTGDELVKIIKPLSSLHYLNLVGTGLTDKGLMELASIKGLKQIYCWQTAVTATGVEAFKKIRPDVKVDMGLIN